MAKLPNVAFLFLMALVAGDAFAETSSGQTQVDGEKQVRVLTIGNSFTQNATRYLSDLVEAAGHRLTHKSLTIGGSSLERHAGMAMAFEADRSDPNARYASGESLQEVLASQSWDFVTIQQLSIKSHNVETYRPFTRQLADIVHRYSPGAKLLVHQTWAYRKDDPRFNGKATSKSEPTTQREMYEALTAAYCEIVKELHAERIPVGDAFWLADNDASYGYEAIDPAGLEQLKHPNLPAQPHSLHVGYRWRRLPEGGERWELGMDGHHANKFGEYLGGCVWLESLFGESPVGNSFVPKGISPKYARFLQTVAHRAVQGGDRVARGNVQEDWRFEDPNPRRYSLTARASEVDPRAKEYPEIGFAFGTNEKPADREYASVDTRVAPQGRLAIWLMGYNSGLFERLNSYGIHAIGVSYARGWFGKLCRPKPSDPYARGRVRLEAATGLDFSDELDLLPPDGAAERARQLLMWLAKENPQGKWEQFLTDDQSRIRWDKVIVTGASHGSTTAARFAKHQRVDRVVMLCGPRDQDQDWQGLPSATPQNRYFGFTHVLDGGWTGDHYCRSWEMLGLHKFGPIVNVDETSPPFGNSRRLISAADVGGDAGRAHSSVSPGSRSPEDADGNKLFDPVWHYLYNHPVEQTGAPGSEDPECLRVHETYETGASIRGGSGSGIYHVQKPPAGMKLEPFYEKYVDASGYPVVSSGKVNDYALKEAAFLIDMMLAHRPDVRKAMVESGSRMIVMAHDELTTDVPEHSHLKPKEYWDARARGLGGSRTDPVCSCGEENLLAFAGDPYSTENILIHEFAHNIHLRGMVNIDKTFDRRLKRAYDRAMAAGLWDKKYASTNKNEYFAEGVQSWFNNNRQPDHDHNHVDTRAELSEYDPGLAELCEEVFGETELEYTKPTERLTGHMAGYDPSSSPRFRWPDRVKNSQRKIMQDVKNRKSKAE
ncbi:MAG: hypothetical protein Aurels2KO_07920 [Aureliella sp.]